MQILQVEGVDYKKDGVNLPKFSVNIAEIIGT